MTWDYFYEHFYDWSESTQINRISALTSFGDEDEVIEVAECFFDEKIVTRFIRKALSCGMKFSPQNILYLIDLVSQDLVPELAKSNSAPYTEDDLDELFTYLSDAEIKALSRKNNINYKLPTEPDIQSEAMYQKKPGFFTSLFATIGLFSLLSKPTKHNGRCNGDCANCPPHYGYRYGRWYYGHDHTEGCEFGGNKCGGGL